MFSFYEKGGGVFIKMVSKLVWCFFSLSFSFPKLYVLYLIKIGLADLHFITIVVTFLVTITKDFF